MEFNSGFKGLTKCSAKRSADHTVFKRNWWCGRRQYLQTGKLRELVDECTSHRTYNDKEKTCSDVSSNKFIDEVVRVFVKDTSTPKLYAALDPGYVCHN